MDHPLKFNILRECAVSRARVAQIELPHSVVDSPVFMPVGTQGSLKGLTASQLTRLGCQIMLGNTYHLGLRPGTEVIELTGGLHSFMQWDRSLLTDSGGFQMVSLLKLAEITEEGVKFQSPHDSSEMLLTPEKSIEIQNSLGADIIMQLDDVVHSLTTGPRVEEAMHRTVRWLDRCVAAHKRPREQNLFPIVQGGLDSNLRRQCAEEMSRRNMPGFAIGGLSGGEEKGAFWQMVAISTEVLPKDKPRYLMGVGYAVDLVVCSALGCDMFDCVYPTRTARFGTALTTVGHSTLHLKNKEFANDFSPIDPNCSCSTCQSTTRAYLHALFINRETVACHYLTLHNVSYQLELMRRLRQSLLDHQFPQFVCDFMKTAYPTGKYPQWAVDALAAVNIFL